MKRISENRIVIASIALLLCVATLLGGCAKKEILPAVWENATHTADKTVGQGAKTVKLYVTAADKSILLTVKTDAGNLGRALLELGLVAGEESQYGLYVKTVNGMTADYDVDGSWWSFNKVAEDGSREAMPVGVDGVEIAGGETYELAMTK